MRDRFTVLVGIILVAIGAIWLIGEATDFDIPWEYVLPVALIAIGAVFIFGRSDGGGPGGERRPASQFERDDAPRVP
jgi:hypothetical protein